MNYYVMTLFLEMIEQGMNTSIIGRAMAKGLLTLTTLNIREHSVRGDGRIDDYPYGGGAGMVMQAEPVCRTYEVLSQQLGYRPRLIYLTPQGKVFNQQMAKEFAQEKDLVFLCGHYEGIDERVLEEIATDFVSIGDYVLTGGELPSMVMMDSISRMVPGVLSRKSAGVPAVQPPGSLERKGSAAGAPFRPPWKCRTVAARSVALPDAEKPAGSDGGCHTG